MAYNDDAVKAKLGSLNETQDSIVSVAQWIMFHRRHADRTATLWLQRLQEAPSANKRLNLIYLANEVVQQSRARSKQDFLIAFEPVIAEATAAAYKGASQDIQGKLRRVLQVWLQRQIFDRQVLQLTESRLEEIDRAKGGIKLGGGGGGARLGGSLFGGGSTGVASELESVNKAQAAVSKAEAAIKSPTSTANASYASFLDPNTPVPSAPVRAAKLRGLAKDLMAARNAVNASLKAREDLLAGLDKLIESNRAKLAAEETDMKDLSLKIDTTEETIRQVEDSIMRGADTPPVDGSSNGFEADPERPETEGFTPPPPDTEAFTPPPQDADTTIGESAPLESPFSNPTAADPIQEQQPRLEEPPPSFVPPPAIPSQEAEHSRQTREILETLSSLQSHTRAASSEYPGPSSNGNPGDPRLKRRKTTHNNGNMDDEIFGAEDVGGVDEDGIAAMLGP